METSTHDGDGMEDYTLDRNILCREVQIKTLLALFGRREHSTPGSVFLYGHTGTGKTLVIQALLEYYKLPHIFINCVECSSLRFLVEEILNNLPLKSQTDTGGASDMEGTGFDDDEDRFIRCDDLTDFVRSFKSLIADSELKKETLYIVLDKAERLRSTNSVILPALLRLQELSGLNVCTIMISEIVWEKFRTGTGFCEPYCINFPDYTRQELLEIMSVDAPPDVDRELYAMYINMVLSVFHMVCRDLRELRHIARLNFDYFIDPVNNGDCEATSTRKLWRNIEPHLKKALKTVYLREVSSHQWELMQQAELADDDSSQAIVAPSRSHVELPFYSKFLLIAAYLASYNPIKCDRRFFAKYSKSSRRMTKLIKKNERASNHLLGPKTFSIDRMMAIFYSIVEGKVIPSAHIYIQISSLVSLHLLSQVGGEDKISAPKYKCLVTLDVIRNIARTVQFDIMRYLYDFL
ncbi:origin recognition complex subunit 5 [Plakobranchus ocellatus]|uniref:Origin recognition complex subunit 5 n=1 Tax=Plakobranchus ocellatus TaxID=259542 RepID=A0AAV4CBB8_9GAST|nr:origin recognition complex subunit 5 [Plakobranchus ocellatus]